MKWRVSNHPGSATPPHPKLVQTESNVKLVLHCRGVAELAAAKLAKEGTISARQAFLITKRGSLPYQARLSSIPTAAVLPTKRGCLDHQECRRCRPRVPRLAKKGRLPCNQ